MIKQLLFLCCLIAPVILGAQNARKDFDLVNAQYDKATNLSMGIRYELYLDNAAQPVETEQGMYKRSGELYYTKQAGVEMLMTMAHTLLVDREEKVLVLDKRQKHTVNYKASLKPSDLSLDSLFQYYKKIEYYTPAGKAGLQGYRFFLDVGPYKVIEVEVNTQTHFVESQASYYREPITDNDNRKRTAVMKIRYTGISTAVINAAEFSENNYIRESKGVYSLVPAYQKFQLINQLH